ncbi:MAG: hypothetical protein LBL39_00890 [Planctomycetaceae bacterium]|jgi:hypothetical protein|nr:hypothetical protein [Planctomycetaceae bacterium]
MSDYHINNHSNSVLEFSSVSISQELQESINNELENDEIIEWIDQPIPCYFSKNRIGIFIFSILWTSFALLWLFVVLVANGAFLLVLFGVLFVIIGVGMLFSATIGERKKLSKTVYVITNRRAIIFDECSFADGVVSYTADELWDIQPKQKKNGTGDIFIFKNIRNVELVEQKLRTLKNSAKQKCPEQSTIPILRRITRNNQYLSLKYISVGRCLPICRVHICGYLEYILSPYLGLPLLYWKWDRTLPNGFNIFIPRSYKNEFIVSNKQITDLFLEEVISLLQKCWCSFSISIADDYVFAKWKLVHSGRIRFSGYRKNRCSNQEAMSVIAMIDECVNKYCNAIVQ